MPPTSVPIAQRDIHSAPYLGCARSMPAAPHHAKRHTDFTLPGIAPTATPTSAAAIFFPPSGRIRPISMNPPWPCTTMPLSVCAPGRSSLPSAGKRRALASSHRVQNSFPALLPSIRHRKRRIAAADQVVSNVDQTGPVHLRFRGADGAYIRRVQLVLVPRRAPAGDNRLRHFHQRRHAIRAMPKYNDPSVSSGSITVQVSMTGFPSSSPSVRAENVDDARPRR